MDHVKNSKCRIRLGRTLVNNLRFGDDIDLINRDYKSLQEQFEKTRAAAKQTGLIVNVGKTKTMVFGDSKNRTRNTHQRQNHRERRQVRTSREPNNLGQGLLRGNKTTNRESSRNNSIPGTRMEWQEANYPEQAQILTICIFSVLLYASETWMLKEN